MEYEPFIMTVSGKKIHFLNPDPTTIDIEDIAYSLANQCRFNGHVPFYTVAEHSVAVASRLPPEQQLAGLLHDASEAYLSDIPSPIKQFLPDYLVMEEKLQGVINAKYGVDIYTPEVKQADRDALHTEAYFLMNNPDWIPATWKHTDQPRPLCLPPKAAFNWFLSCFKRLTKVEPSLILTA